MSSLFEDAKYSLNKSKKSSWFSKTIYSIVQFELNLLDWITLSFRHDC